MAEEASGVVGPQWAEGAQAVFLGLREWRALPPQAPLREIEAELDRRWAALRGQMLADLALASAATAVTAPTPPVCPQCGGTLRDEGVRQRTLRTTGQAAVPLRRDYATCTACGYRFFPLDIELGLLPNHRFTPRVEEVLARLGSTVAFAEARDLLRVVLGMEVSEATLRQRTYSAGTAALAVEAAAAPAPATPAPGRRQLSLDATKVPLIHGAWTDVKLAVFADLAPGPPDAAGRPTAEAVTLSYVARWAPAEQFGEAITPEAQRRRLDEAPVVVSPNDGAEWIQGNLDLVAPQAIRILDFPHAVEHLSLIAALVYGEGTAEARAWVAVQRQALLDAGAPPLLAALARCQARGPSASARPDAEGRTPAEQLAREVAYFTKRQRQVAYPTFRQQGYPIGSGIVESGHKVVIAPRCKRAGQHWAAPHLNPLLALRCASCNDRWDTTWAALWTEQCQQTAPARRLAQLPRPAPPVPPPPAAAPRPKLVVNGRPAATHPWRRFAFGAARRPGG